MYSPEIVIICTFVFDLPFKRLILKVKAKNLNIIMESKDIITRLKQSIYKRTETDRIMSELKLSSNSEQKDLSRQLHIDIKNSENSQVVDGLNTILAALKSTNSK